MTETNGIEVRLRQEGPIPLDTAFASRPGEVLALVGPSGSGKTTILRSIAGLYRPREGRVACNGALWLDRANGVDVPSHRRAVGFVFQNYALFPHMTALGNVAAALGHLPRQDRAARARDLLKLVHLSGLEGRRPAALSGGQQQRVAVARALARNPATLLLDEPFSAVDKVTRQKLYRELADLRREFRIPVVLVTHDLDEASSLADRLCILHRGVTLQSGPPFEVMTRPCTAAVARLIDLKNIFEGRVAAHRPEAGLTLVAWRGRELEARFNGDHAVGSPVCWVVPPASVILHRPDRPSRGERENPVSGTVAEAVPLGESTSVILRVDGDSVASLSLSVPTHVARRNGIAVGAAVTVSLLAENIHLMPWEAVGDGLPP